MPTEKKEKEKIYKDAWIGDIAAAISICSYVPLILHVTFNKATYSLHYYWLLLGLASSILWFIYGDINDSTPNVVASFSMIIVMLYFLIIKIYFESTGQAHHQTNSEDEPSFGL